MKSNVQKDTGEEILIKLKELEKKLIQLLKIKNEKEYPIIPKNRN